MPLTAKGEEILSSMEQEYGAEKGKEVFYASKNAGKITGVDTSEGLAPAPEILTIPTKVTAKQINKANREYWEPNGTPSGS